MRLLVCGSRDWDDRDYVFNILDETHHQTPISFLIEGGAAGADTLAREWREYNDLPGQTYEAAWGTYGKAAGPLRNQRMLNDGKPDAVVAFTKDLTQSRGTADMVRRAREAGVPVYVYGETA